MIYGRMGATIHTFSNTYVGGPPSTSQFNLVLGGGESAVETLNTYYMGGWKEQASARLPDDGLQSACSVVVASLDSPHDSYIHLLGGLELETSWGTNAHYRLLVTDPSGVSAEGWETIDVLSQ